MPTQISYLLLIEPSEVLYTVEEHLHRDIVNPEVNIRTGVIFLHLIMSIRLSLEQLPRPAICYLMSPLLVTHLVLGVSQLTMYHSKTYAEVWYCRRIAWLLEI